MTFVVGVTGGIGSGKSTVADRFAELGAAVVDTDAIAHALTGPGGAAMPAIAACFGATIRRADGALDRAAMRRQVFADPAARASLESILHPLIRQESERRCLTSTAPYVLLVVPLLVETSGSYRDRVDRILVIDCAESTQIARVMARNALSADEVRAILAAQATRAARLAVADDILANDAGADALNEQIALLHARYLELAAARTKAAGS